VFDYKIIIVFFTVCVADETSLDTKMDANLLAHMVLAQKLFKKKMVKSFEYYTQEAARKRAERRNLHLEMG
jgi:hypothetical protein